MPDWTLDMRSKKLRLAGWNVSRASLAKIEVGRSHVADHHLFFLAKVLEVPTGELFPMIDPQDPNLLQTLNRFMNELSWEDET